MDKIAELPISLPNPMYYRKSKMSKLRPLQCIDITKHMDFCCGNAFKYVWRAGKKAPDFRDDLKKALWYIQKAMQDDVKHTPSVVARAIFSLVEPTQSCDGEFCEAERQALLECIVAGDLATAKKVISRILRPDGDRPAHEIAEGTQR